MDTDTSVKMELKTKLKGRQLLSFNRNTRLEHLQVGFIDYDNMIKTMFIHILKQRAWHRNEHGIS